MEHGYGFVGSDFTLIVNDEYVVSIVTPTVEMMRDSYTTRVCRSVKEKEEASDEVNGSVLEKHTAEESREASDRLSQRTC